MGGEEVLLNPDSGMYHLVNPTGRALLSHMEAGRTFEEAVRVFAEETGQPVEGVVADATAFVEGMMARGLLEPVVPP